MKARPFAILAIVALVASACTSSSGTPGPKAVKLGVELPLSGGELPNGDPTLKGVQLAINQNPVPGYTITINKQDDAVNGVHNPNQGATNIQALINDSSVFAVVGPFNSNVAQAEIPKSNSAGLIQCSPANTNPSLTKGQTGLDLRKANPDQDRLRPCRHDRRHPGPGGRGHRLQRRGCQERLRRRRHRDLRQGPGGRLRRLLHQASVALSSAMTAPARTSSPTSRRC